MHGFSIVHHCEHVMKPHSLLFCPTRDRNHPFAQHLQEADAPHLLGTLHPPWLSGQFQWSFHACLDNTYFT